MATPVSLSVEDVLRVNGSRRFAAAMAAASPFKTLSDAIVAARRIWLNEVPLDDSSPSLYPCPSLSALTWSLWLAGSDQGGRERVAGGLRRAPGHRHYLSLRQQVGAPHALSFWPSPSQFCCAFFSFPRVNFVFSSISSWRHQLHGIIVRCTELNDLLFD
jgi:hypothetical protein